MSDELWQLFYRHDPYDGFDPSGYPDDCVGWGSAHPIFDKLITALRPNLIFEVGSWKGASAINMATIAERLELPTKLICIDTWLGTRESFAWKDTVPTLHDDLRIIHGWPHLYYQFLSNVRRRDLHDRIIPLPQTSTSGLRLLHTVLQADLIYIDGSHDYEDVKADLRCAWECLSEHGVMFGDDYLGWESVTSAVNEFCIEHDLILMGDSGKFAFAKSGNIFELLGAYSAIEPDGSCAGLRLQRLRGGHANG